jgi:FtsP/CotA-like multicopper oxidase with cupredoxin domain
LIEVRPGERVSITLHNKLPADPSCVAHESNPDIPHCFNGTNLHAHGLWVSPTGNSDNVLLSINPGVDFEYEYNIPADHPSGTVWYHSHRHGSTALQVSSGMAGALIVRGERPPTLKTNGDIDILLKNQDLSAMEERILVLQQIQYACLDAKGNIKVQKDDSGKVVAWVCDPGDVGGIGFYDDPSGQGLFGPRQTVGRDLMIGQRIAGAVLGDIAFHIGGAKVRRRGRTGFLAAEGECDRIAYAGMDQAPALHPSGSDDGESTSGDGYNAAARLPI